MTGESAPGFLPGGARCLYSAEAVTEALEHMARALTAELRDSRPLVLIVLTGGLYVGAALTQRLPFALDIDFIRVSRYGRGTQPGRLVWRVVPHQALAGRFVLLVDDVWDEGRTLAELTEWALRKGARKVRSAVLVHKEPPARPGALLPVAGPDYCGLRAGREWIVGWGMDFEENGRNLPAIYVLPGKGPLAEPLNPPPVGCLPAGGRGHDE
jgi:hypoxanthine phosphoribosyltransferase